jgi:hypothetical protein
MIKTMADKRPQRAPHSMFKVDGRFVGRVSRKSASSLESLKIKASWNVLTKSRKKNDVVDIIMGIRHKNDETSVHVI